MSFHVGNQTSCWTGTTTEPFEYALARGFDAFEWFPDKKPGAGWDASDLDARTRRSIKETAGAHGMRLSVHARWQANPLVPDGLQLLWEDLELARDVGAALLNIHLFHESGLDVFVQALQSLIQRTADANLQLSIENTPHHSPEQFNELFARLGDLGFRGAAARVGMCLDVGHANLSSSTRNDYLGFCGRLDPEVPIIHLHLHENWGDADSHLPLFTGPASRDDAGLRRLIAWLQQRSFSGSVILEQWPQPPSLLDQARERLLQLWNPKSPTAAPNKSSPGENRPEQSTAVAPATDFTGELVAGNARSRSWREKLELVSALLTREEPALTLEQFVDLAIFLRFLGTGQIACAEDGRHFRPAHHARIAAQIRQRLVGLRAPENEFILRKIYPWLPSSGPAFQRPEPLTRIRDIAHRNDIGQDLKREIKTTLQNKLHRCAGPEDLATSSALLERISGPGAGYPAEFVEQFRMFHQELKEFFNARSLDERLEALLPRVPGATADLVRTLLGQKTGRTLEEHSAALRTLTKLRRALVVGRSEKPASDAQELLLADIALEDFAFALLSQVINECETLDPGRAFNCRVEALTLAVENLALSGIDPAETQAVGSELQAWGKVAPGSGRDELLRLRATLSRCRRLAEDCSSRTVALFSPRAKMLGHALGIAEHAIRVFAEADIRGQVVFQVSKLADVSLRQIREELGLPPWDVIVSGCAAGQVVALKSLEGWRRGHDGAVLVLLESAVGDEEIPRNVVAIALAHELPHLSHLSIRARQAGIVLVASDEESEFARLRRVEGQWISLTAFPDKISWVPGASQSPAPTRARAGTISIPEVRLSVNPAWIPIEEAVGETSGGKGAGARRLAELAALAEAGFSVPASFVIPFGIMEAALEANPAISSEHRELVQKLNRLEPDEFVGTVRRLRELVQLLPVSDDIISEVRHRFPPGSALVVRSSANCEDLESFAGAGLYDSVINVSADHATSAIRRVWSSIWTQRAAESRRAVGIPHEKAYLAVLVQELLNPDVSFVLHTINPLTQDLRQLYAEIVIGLGETLASAATSGSPYRLTIDKHSGVVTTLAFASFSQAARPDASGGVRRETVDYSQVDLSRDESALEKLGRQLSAIGTFVEAALGAPQDIEGLLVGDRVYLVQSRPQQGLAKAL